MPLIPEGMLNEVLLPIKSLKTIILPLTSYMPTRYSAMAGASLTVTISKPLPTTHTSRRPLGDSETVISRISVVEDVSNQPKSGVKPSYLIPTEERLSPA